MGQGLTDRLTGLRAGNARGVLLGAASLIVVILAVALVLAGVTSGEVAATVLFLPVFAAGFMAGRTAGYGAAVVATLVYVALRREDLTSAGAASSGVLTLTRAGAYLVAGHVGALAQVLVPGGAATPASGRASARPGPGDRRRPPRPEATSVHRPVEPAWDQVWDDSPPADRRAPVLAGVGSPGAGAGADDGHDRYDPYSESPQPMSMSNAWPPEPPREPWRDEPSGRPARGPDDRGWDEGGDAWPAEGGWQAGDDAGPLEDDSWAAVQQSWREQHGVPEDDPRDDPRGPARGDGGRTPQDGWPYDQAPGGPAAREPWPDSGAPADPWGDAAPTGGTWPQGPQQGTGGWQDAPPAQGAGGGWHDAPAGGGWQDAPPAPGGGGWPDAPPAVNGWDASAGAPTSDGRLGETGANRWGGEAPTNGWAPETGAAGVNGWGPDAASSGGWPAEEAVNGHDWSSPPDAAPQGPGWDAPAQDDWSHTGQTQPVWDDPAAGHGHQPDHGRDHPDDASDPWGPPASAGWAAPATAPAPYDPIPGRATGQHRAVLAAGHGSPNPALPAVDPETGLWTAKFLRDRLSSEQVRSRRSGRPFSLVLVQVPDGPLAQLPYRRQLTLLRELGYQFVAGGVVDHLVHVPDQAQHWFAVILPDTDRTGAQVLERRLRLGIGGYLSSRGLRLRDLESASLTAPDDDPAMGAIWDALIGPDGDDGSGYHR